MAPCLRKRPIQTGLQYRSCQHQTPISEEGEGEGERERGRGGSEGEKKKKVSKRVSKRAEEGQTHS